MIENVQYNVAVFVPGAMAPYRFLDVFNFTFDNDSKVLEFEYHVEGSTHSKAIFAYVGFILETIDKDKIPKGTMEQLDMQEDSEQNVAIN